MVVPDEEFPSGGGSFHPGVTPGSNDVCIDDIGCMPKRHEEMIGKKEESEWKVMRELRVNS